MIDSESIQWHAIMVRSRHEHAVQRALAGKGYEELLPTYRDCSQWSDRVRFTERALFAGYLFGRFRLEDRLSIRQIPGVAAIVGNGATPVDAAEIDAIQRVVASGFALLPCPLPVGSKVLIENGPFRGIEGVIQRIKQQSRLIITVSLLQRSVSVEVENAWLSPVPFPSARVGLTGQVRHCDSCATSRGSVCALSTAACK